MTPKEKAKQLAIKFVNNTDVFKPNIASIEKALICVDEQLELLNTINSYICDNYEQFLEEVKDELHQL